MWKNFETEKPEHGQVVVLLGEEYETNGKMVRDIDVAVYKRTTYEQDEEGVYYEIECPHFETPNYGTWVFDPVMWCAIPELP